ncbi:MAG: DHH family phosphoesterase [Acholeplasmataceae bacterium]
MSANERISREIERSKRIIIHRHERPDMDAIGSQYGLALLLRENYPDKEVYAVGDVNDMVFDAVMDDVSTEQYADALVIITDVSVSHMISDDRYLLARRRIIIDHHTNDTDVADVAVFHRDDSFSSASEMIIDHARATGLSITPEAALYLYGGMVTDTGRFLHLKDASRTFELASYITGFKPDIERIYTYLYTEPLKKRRIKHLFSDFELTAHGVAYRRNTHDIVRQSGLDFQTVSRGMVNQMAGIKEVPIWANFTEDIERNAIIGEFRSRGISIVDIAKTYGGGGHDQACGATLKDWQEVDRIIKDLDERAKAHGTHT